MGIVARQSIKASISNYIGVLIGFASLLYFYPLFFTPKELGAIRLLLELGIILGSFGLLGTTYSINRFFPYFKNPPKNNGFFFWVYSLPLFGYLLTLIGLIFFKNQFIGFFKNDIQYLEIIYPSLLPLILFGMLLTVTETASSNHGRISIPNAIKEIFIRGSILIAALLFYFKWFEFETLCYIIMLIYLAGFILNIIHLRWITPIYLLPNFNFFKQNKEVKDDAIKYTSYLFISGAASLIVSKIDFLMISSSKSLEFTAIYSIGFYLAVLIEIPKRTIMQISNPLIALHMRNKDMKKVSEQYKLLSNNQFLIGAILFLMIWLNIETVFYIMPNGDFYREGKLVVFLIGIGKLLEMIGITASPIISNSKYYGWGLISSLLMISSAVFLNNWLIPIFGINGAALATVLTFIVGYGFVIFLIYNKMKIHPFTFTQLKTFLLIITFLPLVHYLHISENPIIDAFIKTPIVLSSLLLFIFKWKISMEFNEQLEKAVILVRKLILPKN